jgi:hypothetical protein
MGLGLASISLRATVHKGEQTLVTRKVRFCQSGMAPLSAKPNVDESGEIIAVGGTPMNIKRKDLQNLQFCKSLILMSLSFSGQAGAETRARWKNPIRSGIAGKSDALRA